MSLTSVVTIVEPVSVVPIGEFTRVLRKESAKRRETSLSFGKAVVSVVLLVVAAFWMFLNSIQFVDKPTMFSINNGTANEMKIIVQPRNYVPAQHEVMQQQQHTMPSHMTSQHPQYNQQCSTRPMPEGSCPKPQQQQTCGARAAPQASTFPRMEQQPQQQCAPSICNARLAAASPRIATSAFR
jgi:ABC-type nickel/cobalt efflux system permease component RcnA